MRGNQILRFRWLTHTMRLRKEFNFQKWKSILKCSLNEQYRMIRQNRNFHVSNPKSVG